MTTDYNVLKQTLLENGIDFFMKGIVTYNEVKIGRTDAKNLICDVLKCSKTESNTIFVRLLGMARKDYIKPQSAGVTITEVDPMNNRYYQTFKAIVDSRGIDITRFSVLEREKDEFGNELPTGNATTKHAATVVNLSSITLNENDKSCPIISKNMANEIIEMEREKITKASARKLAEQIRFDPSLNYVEEIGKYVSLILPENDPNLENYTKVFAAWMWHVKFSIYHLQDSEFPYEKAAAFKRNPFWLNIVGKKNAGKSFTIKWLWKTISEFETFLSYTNTVNLFDEEKGAHFWCEGLINYIDEFEGLDKADQNVFKSVIDREHMTYRLYFSQSSHKDLNRMRCISCSNKSAGKYADLSQNRKIFEIEMDEAYSDTKYRESRLDAGLRELNAIRLWKSIDENSPSMFADRHWAAWFMTTQAITSIGTDSPIVNALAMVYREMKSINDASSFSPVIKRPTTIHALIQYKNEPTHFRMTRGDFYNLYLDRVEHKPSAWGNARVKTTMVDSFNIEESAYKGENIYKFSLDAFQANQVLMRIMEPIIKSYDQS